MTLFVIMAALFLIDFVIKSKLQVKSAEFGKEARSIAVNELNVPDSYYNFLVATDMDGIKAVAMDLQKRDTHFASMNWPQALAWVIYGSYKQDCVRAYKQRNMNSYAQLYKLNISNEEIQKTACSPQPKFHYAATMN